jgi:cytochrome c oxidase cbb3-type subunit 2
VVPESVMPKYAFMMNNVIDGQYIADKLSTNAMVGVPYTEAMIENAIADFAAQADPNADTAGLQERYGAAAFGHLDVNVSNFDGQPELTEMDAIIAYLQVLGTMVDFTTFIPDPTR